MKKIKVLACIIVFVLLIGIAENIAIAAISPEHLDPIAVENNDTQILNKTIAIVEIVVAWMLVFVIYIIPIFVALKRKHPQKFPIACLDIFLGWTVLGWIICLVWALSDTKLEKNNKSNKYEDLERLQRLKDNGTISEEEFEKEKQKILNQ